MYTYVCTLRLSAVNLVSVKVIMSGASPSELVKVTGVGLGSNIFMIEQISWQYFTISR